MSDLNKTLGKQIAYFRRRAGLTQEELAELTSYSVDFIGLVERGINAPTLARLEGIAAAVGVEAWQLLKPSEKRIFASTDAHKKNRRKKVKS